MSDENRYRGIPTEGKEFFEVLKKDEEFCAELGRVVFAVGRLEAVLKKFIDSNKVNSDVRGTLGHLIKKAKKESLPESIVEELYRIRNQRNYLIHNIYNLLSGEIEETILEGKDLLDADVTTYTDRAWQLKENLNALARIVEEKL